jgi:hypothetical protein
MEGGLLQLIAKDVKDMPLIGKPEITPFKKLYRKYNPFAIMNHQVILPDLKLGSHFNSKISNAGDLISKVSLEIEIPNFLIQKGCLPIFPHIRGRLSILYFFKCLIFIQ